MSLPNQTPSTEAVRELVGENQFDAWLADHDMRVLQPFVDLFAGGPDTACRTTWRSDGWLAAIECVEVPADAVRAAFGMDPN